ncbi:MAG: sensor histidine kinase, partial [Bacteroidota bacterium]
VVIDHKLLEQVMINLIRNSLEALEHTEKALMTIRAEIKNGQTHISVEDNGCGIEEAHLDQIFVPFFTTKKGGTGIGLALVRQIVLLHKGQIDVKSKPQHGTVVTMML